VALFFNNSQGATKISAPPRVITVYDNLGGCPPSRSNPLLSITATVSNPSFFRISATMIRAFEIRTDGYVFIQGPAGSNYATNTKLTNRLNWTSVFTWDNVVWDVGAYGNAAGTYTITLTADSPSSWGCGRFHGRMSTLILETQ
jgi:hypothetical protein